MVAYSQLTTNKPEVDNPDEDRAGLKKLALLQQPVLVDTVTTSDINGRSSEPRHPSIPRRSPRSPKRPQNIAKGLYGRVVKAWKGMDPWMEGLGNKLAMGFLICALVVAVTFLLCASWRDFHRIVFGRTFLDGPSTLIVEHGHETGVGRILESKDKCVFEHDLQPEHPGRTVVHDLRYHWSALVDEVHNQCLLFYLASPHACTGYPFDLDSRMGLIRPNHEGSGSFSVLRRVSEHPVRSINCAGPEVTRHCSARPSFVVYDTVIKHSHVDRQILFRLKREQGDFREQLQDKAPQVPIPQHQPPSHEAAMDVLQTVNKLTTNVKALVPQLHDVVGGKPSEVVELYRHSLTEAKSVLQQMEGVMALTSGSAKNADVASGLGDLNAGGSDKIGDEYHKSQGLTSGHRGVSGSGDPNTGRRDKTVDEYRRGHDIQGLSSGHRGQSGDWSPGMAHLGGQSVGHQGRLIAESAKFQDRDSLRHNADHHEGVMAVEKHPEASQTKAEEDRLFHANDRHPGRLDLTTVRKSSMGLLDMIMFPRRLILSSKVFKKYPSKHNLPQAFPPHKPLPLKTMTDPNSQGQESLNQLKPKNPQGSLKSPDANDRHNLRPKQTDDSLTKPASDKIGLLGKNAPLKFPDSLTSSGLAPEPGLDVVHHIKVPKELSEMMGLDDTSGDSQNWRLEFPDGSTVGLHPPHGVRPEEEPEF